MTCAFAVRGALKKLAGVESVEVSLNKGLANVKLKPGNSATVEQFWDTVKKNGFTPKETHVVARGDLSKSQLKVTGTDRTYDAVLDDKTLHPTGKTATIEGTLTPSKDPPVFHVQRIRP